MPTQTPSTEWGLGSAALIYGAWYWVKERDGSTHPAQWGGSCFHVGGAYDIDADVVAWQPIAPAWRRSWRPIQYRAIACDE